METDRRALTTARAYVAAQLALLALVAVLPPAGHWAVPPWAMWVAGAGAVAGLGLMVLAGTALGRGLTATPIPNRHAVLRTGGLYRWVRHPIYTGLLLAASCVTAVGASWWRLAVLVALVGLINVKARFEERHLARRFDGYAAYAARTPRFVPVPWRTSGT